MDTCDSQNYLDFFKDIKELAKKHNVGYFSSSFRFSKVLGRGDYDFAFRDKCTLEYRKTPVRSEV